MTAVETAPSAVDRDLVDVEIVVPVYNEQEVLPEFHRRLAGRGGSEGAWRQARTHVRECRRGRSCERRTGQRRCAGGDAMSRAMLLAELLPDVAGVPVELVVTGLVQDSRQLQPGDAFLAGSVGGQP